MLALLLAAALVPASADGALVIEDASGIRSLLTTAGKYTATLSPATIGRTLASNVGVDLLAEQPEWGLAKKGRRALVFMRGSIGLSAPIADVKSAKRALAAWLTANRAGKIVSKRLFTASGPRAAALVKAMSRPGVFTRDKSLLAHATGPAWLYLKGRPPLRAAVLQIDASATGLIARGLVQPLQKPILAGPGPGPCAGSPPGCLRASLGPSGRELLSMVLSQLRAPALPESQSVVVRLESIDAEQLAGDKSLPRALRITASAAQPAASEASLNGQLDVNAIESAVAKLTPLDALHGTLAAGVYATNLIYAHLLRAAGPITLSGTASSKAAEIEIRLPLH